MKKTLAILLVLTMLFAFAACGGAGGKNGQNKDLQGTWHLYSGEGKAIKATIVIKEDGTGIYTTSIDARDTVKPFTYTDASSELELTFEDGTSAQWSYTLEDGKLTVGNNTFEKAAQ